jgi:hypothetical protein
MVLLLLALSGFALDDVVLTYDKPPPPPDTEPVHLGVTAVDNAVVVRIPAELFTAGLTYDLLNDVVIAAVQDHPGYDFVVVQHSPALPNAFDAAAFHLAYNNEELRGTGRPTAVAPHIGTRSVLWMNHLDYWEAYGDAETRWVFAHEVSHYWLAFPRLPDAGHRTDLLGRQTAHWSYFVDTPNSPIEGNAWIDNGDGTFTTDIEQEPRFGPLDLYMMGFIPPEQVPDFFYIDAPSETTKERASGPQHRLDGRLGPETVRGTRVDVSIGQIIAANGVRKPSISESPTSFRMLPVLVVGPNEIIDPAWLQRMGDLQETWTAGWNALTLQHATCSFDIDGAAPIPPLAAPALVPGSAR